MPTQGFNIKSLMHDGFKLNVWDIGGMYKFNCVDKRCLTVKSRFCSKAVSVPQNWGLLNFKISWLSFSLNCLLSLPFKYSLIWYYIVELDLEIFHIHCLFKSSFLFLLHHCRTKINPPVLEKLLWPDWCIGKYLIANL